MNKVSIIIRTKNEEVWISSCLNSIINQTFKNYQIVVVDNESNDLTLKILENFPVKVVNYAPENGKYMPGEALNIGIREASDSLYYVFISAHCITKNEYWLEEFVKELESNKKFAGIYGKQEPLAYSSAQTKRDLAIAFGSDPRTQKTDPFFHNANSIIRKEALFPDLFNEKITNIEDRDWARNKLKEGWHIRYSAKSPVYHYHGIHHDNNPSRMLKTANVLNQINLGDNAKSANEFSLAFVMSLRSTDNFDEDLAFFSTKELAKGFRKAHEITDKLKIFIVSSKRHFEIVKKSFFKNNLKNIEVLHIERDLKLDKKWISILDVMQFALEKIKNNQSDISHICYLDAHYLFRSADDMKLAINKVKQNSDNSITLTVLFGEEIPNNKYLFESNEIHDILSESFRPSSTKTNDNPKWRIHSGYCTIFAVSDIQSSALFSNEIELISPKKNLSTIRINNSEELNYIINNLNINFKN